MVASHQSRYTNERKVPNVMSHYSKAMDIWFAALCIRISTTDDHNRKIHSFD